MECLSINHSIMILKSRSMRMTYDRVYKVKRVSINHSIMIEKVEV